MPWYKIEANTGPGHQSHYLNYVWQDEKLTRSEREDLFESELQHRDAIGTIVAVRRLPAKVRDHKIVMYKQRIENANRMIALLTPQTER